MADHKKELIERKRVHVMVKRHQLPIKGGSERRVQLNKGMKSMPSSVYRIRMLKQKRQGGKEIQRTQFEEDFEQYYLPGNLRKARDTLIYCSATARY